MKRSFNAAQVPHAIALESVQVASPCHADWDAMHGDDRSRFCPSCAKNVYNLSAMTRDDAQFLLQEKEGRLCVRFFLREDGTMLTQDCPVGVAALKERSPSFALWAGVASLIVLAGALLSPSLMAGAHAQPEPQNGQAPAQTVAPTPEATAIVEPQYPAMMGDVAPMPRPTVVPARVATVGEMTVVPTPSAPAPAATVKPEQLTPLMGKPSMPIATPTPHAASAKMGSIAAPQSTPTPVPPPKNMHLSTMGMVAISTIMTSQPAKKGDSKKVKSSKKK
ncbi:hypothetical protein IAD21_05638 [Abditibacteriota bacterium]|nr:hypothetical protein IAD21_05638 [Abditibacteriota bacterium]